MTANGWRTIAIAEAVILLAVGIALGVVLSRGASPTPTVATSPASSPAATTPTSPAPSPAAIEALTALKGLRSVLAAGVSYGDYARRVGKMKIHVDRYLENAPPPGSDLAREAAEFYILATPIWLYSQGGSVLQVSKSRIEAAKAQCPAFRQFLH